MDLSIAVKSTSSTRIICYCAVGIYVLCQFTRWLPRLCLPHVSLFRRKARLVCTIGTSPLSMWWWVVDACTLFTTPITVSARTCQQWQVPLVDGRRATYELHGVAANGLTMCMLCCICMYGCLCKMWRNCGWRWDNKFAILNFISSFYFVLHVVFNLVTYPITWL
jgi:hypothetical protein